MYATKNPPVFIPLQRMCEYQNILQFVATYNSECMYQNILHLLYHLTIENVCYQNIPVCITLQQRIYATKTSYIVCVT